MHAVASCRHTPLGMGEIKSYRTFLFLGEKCINSSSETRKQIVGVMGKLKWVKRKESAPQLESLRGWHFQIN